MIVTCQDCGEVWDMDYDPIACTCALDDPEDGNWTLEVVDE